MKAAYLKRISCAILALVMLFTLASCASTPETNELPQPTATAPSELSQAAAPADYKAGTYSAVSMGRNGNLTVEVTFSESEIIDVTIGEHKETEGLSDPAITRIPEEIIANQSLAVDVVSGATLTSRAILAGVEDCVVQAGGDVAVLKAKSIEKAAGQPIEKTADVIIVGGGGAGIAAALSAVENGASVILIEKTAALGGNTLQSGGGWNSVNPTLVSQTPSSPGQLNTLKSYLQYPKADAGEFADILKTLKAQINEYLSGDTSMMFDSVELHMFQTYIGGRRQDLDGNWNEGSLPLISILCGKSQETKEWLQSYGGEFTDTLGEGIGTLWKRGTQPKNKLDVFFTIPAQQIVSKGGEIMLDTTGNELITENGRVIGVKGEKADGTPVTLHANKAVVLATGGFAANKEMVLDYNNYWPELDSGILSTSVSSAVGEGILMGTKAGAAITGMEFTQLMPLGWANTGILSGGFGGDVMYVTPEGKRFVNEYAERDVISLAIIENGSLYYEIKTDTPEARGMWINLPTDTSKVIYTGDTVEDIASQIGCDANTLKSEIEKYNTYVESGVDTDFNKSIFTAKIEAPYLVRVMKPTLHHTMGGLVINTDCQVLNEQRNAIPGLYAAGEVTGGIHAGNRVGGNAIADIFVFGRIAGANAAQD